MKEYPILLNAQMVRAILDGRKTQTRRVIKVQPPEDGYQIATLVDATWSGAKIGNHCWIKAGPDGFADIHEPDFSCPFGSVGDRLWVRETWSSDFAHHYPHDRCWYAADDDRKRDIEVHNGTRGIWSPESNAFVPFKWRPSIHMPRWASRILLEITDIRVERLQGISNDDAVAEGIGAPLDIRYAAIDGFKPLWESVYGERSWDVNPWVWAITFKRVQS